MTPVDSRTAAFFALLRSGLYERPLSEEEQAVVSRLQPADWTALVRLARRQTVTGLLYRAVNFLPESTALSGDLILDLMAYAGGLERENRRKTAVMEALLADYTLAGLHPVVMKGATVAAYYVHPELRYSGDIDLYFPPEEFERACRLIDGCSKASDGTVHFRRDNVDIDLHDRYFDLHCAAGKLPAVGTPEATVLMLSAHILKHAVGAGIGIRQLCDLAMAWQALRRPSAEADIGIKPAAMQEVFRRTGILRWNRLLFSFLEDYLGLSDSPLADQRVCSDPLLEVILEGGNFGHFAAARTAALQAGASGERAATRRRKRNTLSRFIHRLPFSLRYAPRETFATMWNLVRGNLKK